MNRVKAIRADCAVGRGSCSSIDECYNDDDLIDELNKADIDNDKDAVRWARRIEGIRLDRALDARWGGDDDVQLEWKREFEERCK